MKTLKAEQLTSDFVECSFANALQLCKDDKLLHERQDEAFLLMIFASGLEIKIQNGDDPSPYSDVTPDLNYDHPHVFVRNTEKEVSLTKEEMLEAAREVTKQRQKDVVRPVVPFFDNNLGE